jgi:uncharacterized protein YcfL
VKSRWFLLIVALLGLLALAGCRNETQNRIRRGIQEFTSDRMYISLYSLDGAQVFGGVVDGKVTRSAATNPDTNEAASGNYIYWFDERGRYHQTNMPYLVTSYERPGTAPTTAAP